MIVTYCYESDQILASKHCYDIYIYICTQAGRHLEFESVFEIKKIDLQFKAFKLRVKMEQPIYSKCGNGKRILIWLIILYMDGYIYISNKHVIYIYTS